jgi:alkylation response protein AidB-like acyl-CoA dehydrogenase
MPSYLRDNPDLNYYLQRAIDWQTLLPFIELDRYSSNPQSSNSQSSEVSNSESGEAFASAADAASFYQEVAERVGEFAATEVAPHAAEIDRAGVRFENGEAAFPERLQSIFEKISALGLHGLNLPRELGGMNMPMLIYLINCELLARADISVMAHYAFHTGPAMAMLLFSLQEGSTRVDAKTGRIEATRWQAAIQEIARGEAWGSMDLTEPNAGSDLAALRTTAQLDSQGQWRLTGEKIFITSGHGKYHFVLARSEPPATADDFKAGLAGLSLFLAPAYRDEPDGRRTRLIHIDRVEHKLGHNGSATVALSFDNSPAELVGKRGDGFRQMLEFMNHARLSVGFESIGLCEAALRLARAYASERRSMGRSLDQHEMIADYLDEMSIDIVALRALAMDAAYHDELGQKKALFGRFLPVDAGRAAQLQGEARAHLARVRRLTPLLKYQAAEKAVEMTRRCLQIHGGNGYMREFGAEKLVRDALVMPIYEGTSQIQALMAMKDTLGGILKAPKSFAKRLARARFATLSRRDPLERRVLRLSYLALSAQQHLITRTVAQRVRNMPEKSLPAWQRLMQDWDPKRDFGFALLHAERLTRILADEASAEILLDQARRHPERRALLESFLDRAEPRAHHNHEEIVHSSGRQLARLQAPRAVGPVEPGERLAAE